MHVHPREPQQPFVSTKRLKLADMLNHSRNFNGLTYRNSARGGFGISVSLFTLLFTKTPQCSVSELLRAHQYDPRPSTLLRHDVEVTRLLENLGRHGWKIPPCCRRDWPVSRNFLCDGSPGAFTVAWEMRVSCWIKPFTQQRALRLLEKRLIFICLFICVKAGQEES